MVSIIDNIFHFSFMYIIYCTDMDPNKAVFR